MGFTHHDKIASENGFYVGAEGSEVLAINASGTPAIGGTALTATAAEINASVAGCTATAAEINTACDLSGQIQTITTAAAQVVTAGKQAVFLNNASATIAATIADASAHQGFFFVKAGLEPAGGQDHTCTITTGTWNGTHKIATFADVADSLLVYFDASGNGTVIVNTGSVSLS
jgi:hypothetical protein